MSGDTSNVEQPAEVSSSPINTGTEISKASASTSTTEAKGEVRTQTAEVVGTITTTTTTTTTTTSLVSTHPKKSTAEKHIDFSQRSLSHSITSEKMELKSYHSKSTKQAPLDQIEAEAVEAAASAMAAVAAAVNSNSKMSPSSAASIAKNKVQKEPLLSAHTSNSNSNLSGAFSSQLSFKDRNRTDIMFTAQEVTVESLKIDLFTMKSLLHHEIQKIHSQYPQITSLSQSKTSTNDVDHSSFLEPNEDSRNKDCDDNESEEGNSEKKNEQTILANSIKAENEELPVSNKTANDVEDVIQQNDVTELPTDLDKDESKMNLVDADTKSPCTENNDDETSKKNDSAHVNTYIDSSKKENQLNKTTIDTTSKEESIPQQDTALSLKQEAESVKKSEDLKHLTYLKNSNDALLRLIILLSSTSQIIPRRDKMQKQDEGDKSIGNFVRRKSINVDESSKFSLDTQNTSDTGIDSSNDNMHDHIDATSNNTVNTSDESYFPDQIKIASKLALDLYSKVQSEYDGLLSCLPTPDNTIHIEAEDKIVLDLLPSCSPDKDATAAFFRACSPQSKPTKKEINETNGGKKIKKGDVVEINEEKVRVTSTDGGIEVSQSSSPTNHKNLQTTSSDMNGSGGNSFFKKDGVSSLTSQGQTKNSALSVVNAIAGAATGVVGGIMTGGNSRSNSPGSRRKQTYKKKLQKTEQNTKYQVQSDANDQDNEYPLNNSSYEEDSILTHSITSEGRDYSVEISREMLGLTVENVLERTIVRTVLANGAAKKAGAKVGSLIVKVGTVETQNLTHFEIIDELRQSQRPLKLVLRRVSKAALHGAREEMGRLIKGAGFGSYLKENEGVNEKLVHDKFKKELSRVWGKKRKDSYLFNSHQFTKQSNKKGNLAKLGERLVWILTLLIIGLERESLKSESEPVTLDRNKHSPKESYSEAAKSVSKVLLDFLTRQFLGDEESNDGKFDSSQNRPQHQQHSYIQSKNQNRPVVKGKSKRQQIFAAAGRLATGGMNKKPQQRIKPGYSVSSPQENTTETPLAQIGDVLHRVQPFLADQFSPPAALLRGEVIALICDVLDYDTEMELSESETLSSSTSSGGSESVGAVNELGSAGSLLKLIVRNCALMKTPGNGRNNVATYKTDEAERKYEGNKFLAVVHRLAASRSTSARVTACSLGPVLWGYLDFPHQLQLRGVITRALHDVEVIVRKSTAGVLHEIAELVFDPRAVPWLVLMCERAMTDPEPQLRASAMTLTWHLAEHLPNAFLGDASKGSRSLSRLPARTDPTFAEVYLLQCKLLPVATRLAEDNSFSVRLAVAAQCDRLCSALGDHWSNVIIDILQALLDDKDERVRSEATLCLPRLVESVIIGSTPSSSSSGVLECLFPTAMKLLKDPSTTVRVSLATSSGELLTLLVGLGSYEELSTFDKSEGSGFKQHKRHVDETLIPLVQRLLHDPDPEVTSAALRAVTNASRGNVKEISPRTQSYSSCNGEKSPMSENIISSEGKKEPVFIPVLSEEQVLRLLPTLSDLATSPQWRVRQSAVEIVPALLGCTQRLEMRSRIAQLCVQLMEDEVDAVRRTAAECLCLGGGSLGGYDGDRGEWVTAIVIPHIQACRENMSAKQRMLCLKMVEVMLKNGVCTKVNENEENTPVRVILEIAASLFDDKVVNVRLNVGRVFRDVAHVLDDLNLAFTIEILSKQIDIERKRERGGDRDVLFFAEKAILRCRHFLKNNKAALI